MSHLQTYLTYPFWNLNFSLLMVLLVIFYLWLLGPFRAYVQQSKTKGSHKGLFLLGIAALMAGWASPLFFIGHVYLWAHMTHAYIHHFFFAVLMMTSFMLIAAQSMEKPNQV